jgi:serine/threonine protein kinase
VSEREDKLASLFGTLVTETPESVLARARELGSTFAGRSDRLPFAAGDGLGPYEVLGVLGSGGQAVVYEARHVETDRRVALKVPLRDVGDRIVREAKLLASLEHPSIVRVLDLSLEGPVPYLVLELCDGWSLEERLEVASPNGLPEKQVLAVAESVLEALHYAHEKGVIHRDVKPANILFDRENHAKVSDFGIGTIARANELSHSAELSQLSLLAGTPLYVAPEQENPALRIDGELDRRADLFSFGKVLFQMLTGASPRTLRPVSRLRPGLDPAWDEYVFKLTEERPDYRYSTARDALRALPRGIAPPTEKSVRQIGPYVLGPLIERGPQGMVYSATHESTKKRVRIRVPDPEWTATPEYVRRFMTNIRSSAVVGLIDIGKTERGEVYAVHEDFCGGSLARLVKERGGRLPWLEAIRIVKEVARALAARGELAHGDVRPETILIDEQGRVKLHDFRAPNAMVELTGLSLGTVHYLAPEKIGGRPGDARSDIYSLGVVFYELLTGHTPYPTVGDERILVLSIAKGRLLPPERFVQNFSPAARRVLGKMLETHPDRRYAFALALLEDLEHLERGTPVSAGEPSMWPKLPSGTPAMPSRMLATVAIGSALNVASIAFHKSVLLSHGVFGSADAAFPLAGLAGIALLTRPWRAFAQLRASPRERAAASGGLLLLVLFALGAFVVETWSGSGVPATPDVGNLLVWSALVSSWALALFAWSKGPPRPAPRPKWTDTPAKRAARTTAVISGLVTASLVLLILSIASPERLGPRAAIPAAGAAAIVAVLAGLVERKRRRDEGGAAGVPARLRRH